MNLRKIAGTIKRHVLDSARNRYLQSRTGVIHVGANIGQERDIYARYGLPVIWIEPIPEQFAELQRDIAPFSQQRAIQALITDKDGDRHTLHVSNNYGASSSILDFKLHKDIWPDVHFVRDIELTSQTLPTALRSSGVDSAAYDVLVLDTQGSELMILRGAGPMLQQFKYIKTEAADFELYVGCATVVQIVSFLAGFEFRLIREDVFAHHASGGHYFDLLFRKS